MTVVSTNNATPREPSFSSIYPIRMLRYFLLISIFVHLRLHSQTTQWQGANSDWRDNVNWSSGVPTPTKNVIVSVGSSGSLYDPYVPVPANGDTARTANLTVQSGASLFFEALGLLVVHGTEKLQNDGAITLGSGRIIFLQNLTFFNGGSFDAGSGTLEFQRVTWASKSGSIFMPGTSTVIFEGSSNQSIIADSSLNLQFYNLQLFTQGTVTVTGSVTVQNDCYVAAGCTLNVPFGSSFFVNGTFINDGVITGSGSVSEPLPIQLSSFSAIASGLSAALRWTTEAEINNYGFEVERRHFSNSHVQWSTIGFVLGAGTCNNPRAYNYRDDRLSPGRYGYRLKQIDFDGSSTYYGAAELEIGLATHALSLGQNYPNPFNPTTTIDFSLPEDGRVILKLYDLAGREIMTLLDEERRAGYYNQVTIDASRFAGGTYLCRLEFNGQQLTRKIILVK